MRYSGILLHITSLPSPFGIGDLGPLAYMFVNLLAENKQSIWQINPLNPTLEELDNNPYNSPSAFAGNTLLIDPERLVELGLLERDDLEDHPSFPEGTVDYSGVTAYKKKLLQRAYERFKDSGFGAAEEVWKFSRFCSENASWLDDYALFSACKCCYQDRPWNRWPLSVKNRDEDALCDLRERLYESLEKEKLLQYLFFQQWFSLKAYCSNLGIKIFGDMPLYVSYDSADVWSHPEIFDLDERKMPLTVSGVPPDQFSDAGQLWGNPTYRWDVLQEMNYSWFIRRIEHNLNLFDLLRIDHFRGLVAYWAVKAGSETAAVGTWIEAPAEDFLGALKRRFTCLPIVAEDLGHITADVREVVDKFCIPGMRVLSFAFGEDIACSPHIPHNYIRNCAAYTGTHDTNTARGWFEEEASPDDLMRLFCYLGVDVNADNISWELIRLVMLSVADIVVMPMQDLLGLCSKARMNRPGKYSGNYRWRLLSEQMKLDRRIRELTEVSNRT